MAAGEMTDFIFELIDRGCGFNSLIVNDGSVRNMLVNILGGVNDGGLNSLTLNNRLNTLVNVVMGQMVGIGSALNGGAFRGSNLLMISDAGVHLLMTSCILLRHWDFAMTMFRSELLVFVFGWQGSFFLNRLDAMLMMMDLVLTSYVLVDLLRLIGSNNLMGSLRLDFGVNCGVVVFSRGEDLNQKPVSRNIHP
jgi:hypothetical protein